MSIWGKVIGAAAGLALGGPLGALIGGIAGHAVDRMRDQARETSLVKDTTAAGVGTHHSEADRMAARQIAFTIAVIVLAAKMAKADGVVSRSEVNAFRQVFQVPEHEIGNVARVFDSAKRDAAGFEPYARQIAELFTPPSSVLEDLLDSLFYIAKADGEVSEPEIAYLREVSRIFGFDAAAFARIRAAHLGPDRADPYQVLGVSHDIDDEGLKAAWRRLVRDNHPDKVMAEGLPEEFQKLATEKIARINAAYDRIKKERGLA